MFWLLQRHTKSRISISAMLWRSSAGHTHDEVLALLIPDGNGSSQIMETIKGNIKSCEADCSKVIKVNEAGKRQVPVKLLSRGDFKTSLRFFSNGTALMLTLVHVCCLSSIENGAPHFKRIT
jgi:hypothetical protein